MSLHFRHLACMAMVGCIVTAASAQQRIGEVDTAFQWLGPDHKVIVEAYDDPRVRGVTCYVSRAKTGGIKGGLGLDGLHFIDAK